MHGAEKGLNELCGMLKTAESDIKKGAGSSHVMAIQNKPTFKRRGNSWKKKGKAKDKIPMPNQTPKASPAANAECFHCKEIGHWKRNCKLYLASLKNKGSKGTSTLGTLHVYVTDHIFLADTVINSWVFDTRLVAHICNSIQGMIRSRSVERGEVNFRVGNNARFATLTVGTMQLHLPSRLTIELNNSYFVPSLRQNILSPSCLMKDGYSFASENNGCVISKDNMFVACAFIVNGVFV
jgi:hypothetical protein